MKSKKRWLLPVVAILLIAVLCIPIKYTYKDGGTVAYKAILYSYTEYHQLQDDGSYYEANEFRFFPFNYFN